MTPPKELLPYFTFTDDTDDDCNWIVKCKKCRLEAVLRKLNEVPVGAMLKLLNHARSHDAKEIVAALHTD